MNDDMAKVEERVRAMLDRNADRAPAGTAMLAAVRQESLRRARRRRSAAGAAMAALTLVAVVSGVAVTRVGPWRAPVQSAANNPALQFVAGSIDVTVPFWLPTPYLYADPVGTLVAGQPVLTLASTAAKLGPITVEVLSDPPELAPKIRAVAPHWLQPERGSDPLVWWTTAGGAWVKLSAPAAYPTEFLTKVLDAMDRSRTMRLPTPVRFDVVPEGFTIDNIDASRATFCPPGVQPSSGADDKLVVSWPATGAAARPTGATAQPTHSLNVATAPDGSTIVTVDSGGSGPLFVRVPPSVRVNVDDLLRFAAGFHRQP